jgi:hypothetical protein
MATANPGPDNPPPAPDVAAGGPEHQGVDVQKLADRVYELMRADIRLGLARGESRTGSVARG